MVKVNAQVHGGRIVRDVEANTVRDVFNRLALTGNYTAMVNSSPATMDSTLAEADFVVFAQAVKGGC